MTSLAYLTHIHSFAAAHALNNPTLSDEVNKKLYGKCYFCHGHNYKVEATVVGKIDPVSGFVINLVDLKKIMVEVTDKLDHKRIDTDIDFFKGGKNIATAENIAIYIWQEMCKMLPAEVKLSNLRIHETEKNIIDYKG